MLQWINDRMKVIGWLFILPLGLIFAVWGVHGIVDFNARQDRALRVNGHDVDTNRIRQAYQERIANLARAYPEQIPEPVRLETQTQIADQFINTALIDERVKAQGYVVKDQDVIDSIQGYRGFQVEGKFNKDAYLSLLREQGYTPERFEAEQRTLLKSRALEGGLFLSSFATPMELAQAVALKGETRELSYAVLPLAKYLAAAKPEEAAIKAYYEAHKDSFRTPDTVTLKYAALRVSDATRDLVVDEAALKAYYDTVKDRYLAPERRHARHILIPEGTDPAAAKKKADEVYALAAKPGADFEALAKQYSQDAGSAPQGGDLGWAEKSFFVGPFADAVFSMQPGEIKGPVKSQFGWHVIKLEGIEAAKSKAFDEVKADLEPEYRRTEAERRFGERQEKIEQLAFEQSGSLEPLAKELGLKIEEIADFHAGLAGSELAANPKVMAAAFSPEVLAGSNSRAIELSPGNVIVLRASNRREPAAQPLEAVRAKAEEGARRELAARDAAAAADRLQASLKAGEKWDAALKPIGVVAPAGKPPAPEALRLEAAKFVARNEASAPRELVMAAFKAPAPAKDHATVGTVQSGNGDVIVYALSAVKPGVVQGDGATERREVAAATAEAEFAAYLTAMRAKADVHYSASIFE